MADDESLTRELEDSDEPRARDTWKRLEFSRLRHPNALWRLFSISIALLVVFWPRRSEPVLGVLVGLGLIVSAAITLWGLRGVRPVPRVVVASCVLAIGIGGFLVAFPAQTEVAVGGAAAVITAAVALNGTSVATNVFEQNAASRVVADWIESFPGHTVVQVGVAGDQVSVVLAGPALEQPPSADALADELSTALARDIDVDPQVRLEVQDVSGD